MSPKLVLHLETSQARPGEVVRGRAEVMVGGRSRRVRAFLEQRDASPDYVGTLCTVEGGTLHQGDLASPASFDFAMQLPADAVPSFRGGHGETFWEVHIQSDEPGLDTNVRERVTVLAASR